MTKQIKILMGSESQADLLFLDQLMDQNDILFWASDSRTIGFLNYSKAYN